MSARLRALSLGAGVQSTTMALMAAHGEFDEQPDCAVFADTGDEPAAVYEHLRWLMSPNVLPFPVHVVSVGQLSAQMLAGNDEGRVPFFVKAGGLSTRQCTRNFKLRPIRRELRRLLGASARGNIRASAVEQWVGISLDEAWRVKPSGVGFIKNRWPLIERGFRRYNCERWLTRNGYPIPPKSSCVYCPYRSDAQHRETREIPADWAAACAVDAALRTPENIARFRGELFVHRSCVPLAEADLSDSRGPDLFNQECEGMCGV